MKTRCPHCGILYTIEEPKTVTFESSQRLRNVAGMAIPTAPPMGASPGFSARRETPAYLPSTEAHISIPFRQSMIFGLFKAPVGGAVAGGLAYLLDTASKSLELTNWGYIAVTGAGMLIVGFWVASQKWESRLGFYDSLLWKTEEASQIDIDGDGHIGQPEAPHRVEVEIQEKGIPREIDTVEIDLPRLRALARLVIVDKEGFSGRTAAKAGISREEEWVPFRDKLIGRRWAAWRVPGSPKKGIVLLPKGEAILKAILPPTLPDDGVYQNVGPTPTHPHPPSNYERFEHIER